ncbi:MAG: metallophosphoesterase [Clostridium sp.]|nr:metallophosphoesterase [Prevotella sp.]MCM1428679.1 metallophosphoesterase [Clostridium sp.]MCM1475054.1 metallophosphoesterase [Muribaculaceae bacterium]
MTQCTKEDSFEFDDYEYGGYSSELKPNSDYVIVIGDIQTYTDESKYYPTLVKTFNWIREQQQHLNNIRAVLFVGDFTNYNSHQQWKKMDYAISHLGKDILFIPVTGNHDYDWNSIGKIKDRNSTKIGSLTSLTNYDRSITEYYEPGKRENTIVPIQIKGRKVNIIALEFGPRRGAVEWVANIVSSHPNEKYLLLNHEFLTRFAEVVENRPYAIRHFEEKDVYTPMQVWEKLVNNNDNLLGIVCGHNGFLAYRSLANSTGREVPIILFNLQYMPGGGGGYVMIWEFPKNIEDVNVSVYNTLSGLPHPNPLSQFNFSFNTTEKLPQSYLEEDK